MNINLAKFGVSSFNHSRDIKRSQNSKSRSRDPFTSTFDLILHSFISALRGLYVPNFKFLASPVLELWRGSQNFKSGSRVTWPFTTPFDV